MSLHSEAGLGAETVAMARLKISCRHLWKIYGRTNHPGSKGGATIDAEALRATGAIIAVQDASLDVAAGEIFVVMGLSGSGKSTLVRCLTGLIQPSAGEVVFDGRVLSTMSEAQVVEIRRHKMGMVFQHFALLPHLTVLGNVAFPLEIQGADKRTRERRAIEMIELVGLSGREDHYPAELSGGQQQRVGIARSLAVEPQVWFLDEPFSALDPLIRREMQDEFLRLQSVLKKTIVFITHDFHEAVRIADRIAIMKDGAIVQIGTPEELVVSPATDYVREFTRDIPRAKVLSARSLMRPISGALTDVIRAPAEMKLEALAPLLSDPAKDIVVLDTQGQAIGFVPRQAVVDVMMGLRRN